MKKKALYTWTWGGTGYNQTYAFTKKEALAEAEENGGTLFESLRNFKRCTAAQEKSYWDNFPIFD